MLEAARRTATSGVLSYRALFTWLNPYGYVSSRIVMPVAIALLFASIGYESGDVARPVVGTALLAIAISPLFGMGLAVGNERQFGTLGLWLATPEGLLSNLAGKVSIHLVDGLLGATLTFAVTATVFDIDIGLEQVGELAFVAGAVVVSSGGLALVVGAAVFRWRDIFTPPNIAMHGLILFSGVIVPLSVLPLGLDDLHHVLPLSHATTAALEVITSSRLNLGSLGWEVAVGIGWGLVGYAGLRFAIGQLRRKGGVDLV